jgi:hypothetical protein
VITYCVHETSRDKLLRSPVGVEFVGRAELAAMRRDCERQRRERDDERGRSPARMAMPCND